MKQIVVYSLMIVLVILQSCSNADEPLISVGQESSEVFQLSEAEQIFSTNDPNLWFHVDSTTMEVAPLTRGNGDIMPLLDYIEYSVKGATSTSTSANQKVLIDSKLASLMGISRQIYVLNHITAKYKFTISGLAQDHAVFKIVNSPNCGIDPSKTGYVRGYTYGQDGDEVTLTTNIVHIISDISGRNYDMYYPCKPENLIWKYKVAYECSCRR